MHLNLVIILVLARLFLSNHPCLVQATVEPCRPTQRGRSCLPQSNDKIEDQIQSESDINVEPNQVFDVTIKALHPSVVYHLLDPSKSNLDGKSAFILMSTIKGATNSIPTEWKFYYFSHLHLGLRRNDPESSLRAFRRCMYLNQSALLHLSRIFNRNNQESQLLVSPSLCGGKMITLTESNSAAFPAGTWSRIPDPLRISLAYHCSMLFDPDFITVMGRRWDELSYALKQAFYFQVAKLVVHHSYSWNILSNLMVGNGAFIYNCKTFSCILQRNIAYKRQMILIAAVHNEERFMSYPHNLVNRSVMRRQTQEAAPHLAQSRHFYKLMQRSFLDLLNDILNQDVWDVGYKERFAEFVKALSKMIHTGLDINILFPDEGHHPIRRAIRQSRTDVLNELVIRGLNIHRDVGFDDYLCDTLSSTQPMVMLSFMLEIGANTRRNYLSRNSILHIISQDSSISVEVAKLLVNYGAVGNVRNGLGWHPVHQAALAGNLELVDYMTHHPSIFGENLSSIRTITGESLFLLACRCQRPSDLLAYLVGGYGGPIDLEQKANNGWSCIDRLHRTEAFSPVDVHIWIREFENLRNYSDDLIPRLPENGVSFPGSFVRACRLSDSDDFQALSLMLKRGANIDEVYDGKSCLALAAEWMDILLLAFLVEHGATIPSSGPAEPSCWLTLRRGKRCAAKSRLRIHPLVAAARAGLKYFELVVKSAAKTNTYLLQEKALIKMARREALAYGQLDVVSFLDAHFRNTSKAFHF